MNTKNKVVLVTGGAKGLGAATVECFAQHGYDVVIHYFQSREEALALAERIEKQYQVKTLCICGDITKEDVIEEIVQEVIHTFGKIDVLVNNAAICLEDFLENKTKEDFMKTYDTNVVSAYLMSSKVSSYMLSNQKGSIVNVSSNNALGAYCPMTIEYDASKAALISLTHNLARAYAPYVRVNAVAPGYIETDMTKCEDADVEKAFREEESQKIFLERFAKPEEIAQTIYFLASEEASYVNNAVLTVDGGF